MIDSVRDYIANCPYLDDFTEVNVNYLVDKVKAYSVNEGASYNPIIATDILGNEESQFQFTFDAKFHWNDEIANNVDNSNFFENFSNWLRENNNNKIFPTIGSDDISITSISANSNGYIFDTSSDEAIYRISCVMNYTRWNND